jgi:hypothetical protein
VSRLSTEAWVADVGLAVGIAAATAGVVLLLTSQGAHHQAEAKASGTAWIGVGPAGIVGRLP